MAISERVASLTPDDQSLQTATNRPGRRYRSVFISGLHLGIRGCKADCLLDFLQHVHCDYLYLVGDIVDGWRLRKRWFWPDAHQQILHRLLARAEQDTEVIYLPGNHDEALRKWIGATFGGVRVMHDVIHHTADGRRLLVIHGDGFDGVCREMKWLALIGSLAYDTSLQLNTWFNVARRWLGLSYWSRGVDTDLFRPDREPALDLARPVHLYVGRVAVEKNLEAFLSMPIRAGSKLVVGGGPQLVELEAKYPDVTFAGARFGEDLARHYASGDVFVFPSLTDTFGLVLLEALATGLPVAAYPVPGPLDVIGESGCGVLDHNLARAAARALEIPRGRCRAHALQFRWRRCAEQFLDNLHPLERDLPLAAE